VTTELKGTVPLNFVPEGNWSVYAGVQYYYLVNHGLLDENQVLATSERKRSLWQVHCGLTIVFRRRLHRAACRMFRFSVNPGKLRAQRRADRRWIELCEGFLNHEGFICTVVEHWVPSSALQIG
jgi:hypothetical protein